MGKPVIGITGGIASGKTMVARFFNELGADIVDVDGLGHMLLLKGSPTFERLVEAFGEGVLNEEGDISREKLGRLVFGDYSTKIRIPSPQPPGLSDNPKRPVCSSITDGIWTLHYRGPDYPAELYNIEDDPAQGHNLYPEQMEEAKRLHDAYLELLRHVGTDERKISLRERLPELTI